MHHQNAPEPVRPRVLLVDDHDVVRTGTRALLESEFDIVGEADNATSAIELALERSPDLILLDVRLPEGGGQFVADELRSSDCDAKIVAFSVSLDPDEVRGMMRAGVVGYLTKATNQEALVDLLNQALRGGRPVSPEVAAHLLDIDDDIDLADPDAPDLRRLTPREREVVRLIARGYSYREAASELGISVKTLEHHMTSIFKKLGIASRHQLSARFGRAFSEGG